MGSKISIPIQLKQLNRTDCNQTYYELAVYFKNDLMKNVILLFLTIFLFSCGHQSPKDKFQKELIKSDNDSLCIKEIEKAKTDLSIGRIVFCMPIGNGGGTLRQEKQLKQLCKNNNII